MLLFLIFSLHFCSFFASEEKTEESYRRIPLPTGHKVVNVVSPEGKLAIITTPGHTVKDMIHEDKETSPTGLFPNHLFKFTYQFASSDEGGEVHESYQATRDYKLPIVSVDVDHGIPTYVPKQHPKAEATSFLTNPDYFAVETVCPVQTRLALEKNIIITRKSDSKQLIFPRQSLLALHPKDAQVVIARENPNCCLIVDVAGTLQAADEFLTLDRDPIKTEGRCHAAKYNATGTRLAFLDETTLHHIKSYQDRDLHPRRVRGTELDLHPHNNDIAVITRKIEGKSQQVQIIHADIITILPNTRLFLPESSIFTKIAYNNDGRLLAAAALDETILFETEGYTAQRHIKTPLPAMMRTSSMRCLSSLLLCFHPDGRRLISGRKAVGKYDTGVLYLHALDAEITEAADETTPEEPDDLSARLDQALTEADGEEDSRRRSACEGLFNRCSVM